MVKTILRAGQLTGQRILLASLCGFLVSCGGGSGDTAPVDADEDGIPDFEDPFVDVDPVDGFDDLTGLTEAQATQQALVLMPTASQPCGDQPATSMDNDSSTATWDDNCAVARQIRTEREGALLGDSLYAAGIQRVIFCAGFGTASSYTVFADGEYGEISEGAMELFQADQGITVDGLVGPGTWAALQASIELLNPGTLDANGNGIDTHGFSTGRCAGVPLFYQATSLANDGVSIDRGGWTLARNQPNETQSIPFSYQLPFGRL